MKRVYQRIVNSERGDCMQAVVASLFEDDYDNVPAFIEHEDWMQMMIDYVKSKGYKYEGILHNRVWIQLNDPRFECWDEPKWHEPSVISEETMKGLDGVDGFFYCGVLSPKYFKWRDMHTHAVICDKNLNIVHDPNRDYVGLRAYPLSSILGCNGIIDVYNFVKI